MLISLFLLQACEQDEGVVFSNTPEIELLNVSNDTIRQYEDILIIEIAYKDGNGDLGFEDPEDYALFVRDIRLANFDGFYVGPVAPPDKEIPVQGTLSVEFPSLFLFGSGDIEVTWFEIKMVDRAGNVSNLLETEKIVIIRE